MTVQRDLTLFEGAAAAAVPKDGGPPGKKPRNERAVSADTIAGSKMEDLFPQDYSKILLAIDADQFNEIYVNKLSPEDRQDRCS